MIRALRFIADHQTALIWLTVTFNLIGFAVKLLFIYTGAA